MPRRLLGDEMGGVEIGRESIEARRVDMWREKGLNRVRVGEGWTGEMGG